MSAQVPRLRMFAGPNGSGKSTIREKVEPRLRRLYINPDDIERSMRDRGFLDLATFGVQTSQSEVRDHFRSSALLRKNRMVSGANRLRVEDGRLILADSEVNAYHASVISDFLRRKLVESRDSFSFETVMSSRDKVDFLRSARDCGYRTYLYYVATADPDINVARVAERVRRGGHDVPEEKIRQRYFRSLDLLMEAVRCSDRAYLFDNSGKDCLWLAEITGGRELVLKVDSVPAWFKKSVLDKVASIGRS